MHIWLDDIRNPKDPKIQSSHGAHGDEVWLKTVPDAMAFLEQHKGEVESISFDHDLGLGNEDAIELAKWLEERAYKGEYPPVAWRVHSDNPVGVKNITAAMTSADRYWKVPKRL